MLLDTLWTWLTLILYGTADGGDVGLMAGGSSFPPPEN